ncbi:MAG: hypothetical protein AB7O62_24255 [Pirellulales bacterium]
MPPLFETVTDLAAGADILRRRPYGVIEIADGQLHRIVLRPWPKLVCWPQMAMFQRWPALRGRGDACRLYYNQPRWHRNYLALKYVVSTNDASFRSFRLAAIILDEIARIKRSDAILCDVANARISDRLLTRWNWQPLRPDSIQRLFIKRFYGNYPATNSCHNHALSETATFTLAE